VRAHFSAFGELVSCVLMTNKVRMKIFRSSRLRIASFGTGARPQKRLDACGLLRRWRSGAMGRLQQESADRTSDGAARHPSRRPHFLPPTPAAMAALRPSRLTLCSR